MMITNFIAVNRFVNIYPAERLDNEKNVTFISSVLSYQSKDRKQIRIYAIAYENIVKNDKNDYKMSFYKDVDGEISVLKTCEYTNKMILRSTYGEIVFGMNDIANMKLKERNNEVLLKFDEKNPYWNIKEDL